MAKSASNRIISTPSVYAKNNYIYVQEVGTLQSLEPHISKRQNLNSYLFFTVLDGCGLTLLSDLTAKRVSHAKSILRFKNASIESIAQECGFQNAGYFIKVFRQSENMTPSKYRRKW